LHAAEQDRADVARRRAQWKKYQGRLDPKRLVFINETWAKTNMARRHGRCMRGTRLVAKAPHDRWRALTSSPPCAAIGSTLLASSIVEQVLVPTLQPGDVVIVDNLRSHKRQAIRRAIRTAGAKLFFLPPYSPDLNPSSRSSPSSRHYCARLPSEPSKPRGGESANSSMPSLRPNAPTTSRTLDMPQAKMNTL
jgi:DDE superfamily endonuclease